MMKEKVDLMIIDAEEIATPISAGRPLAWEDQSKISVIKNGAIATSGDYERFFFEDGKRYHHILNPKTGYPAQGLISVSIFAESATLADMLATAVFVLGKEKGVSLIENWEGAEALLVTDKGEIIETSSDFRPQTADLRPQTADLRLETSDSRP